MMLLRDSNGDPFRLIISHRRREDEEAIRFFDEREVFASLRRIIDDDLNRVELRRFAVEADLISDSRSVNDRRLLKLISSGIASGRLMAVRPGEWTRGTTSGESKEKKDDPPPPPEPAPPPPPTTEKTWIKFEIIDNESGKPVSGVTLKVKLADGGSRSATSNAAGLIEITNIPPGTCEIERMIDSDTLEVVSIQ
jgi:hypothetical protein